MTRLGWLASIGILAAGIGTCNYLTCKACSDNEAPAPVIQRQVLSIEPLQEGCIVRDGVRYCPVVSETADAGTQEMYQGNE